MKKALKNNYIDQGTEMAASYFDNEAMKTFSVFFCSNSNIMAGTEWNKNGLQGTMSESPYIDRLT